MKFRITKYLLLTVITMLYILPAQAEEIVIYSARKDHLIRPLFDSYTQKTGVKIKYITGKAPLLLQKLKSEGKHTPADLLITVDAGNLWHAANEGVLQRVSSKKLTENIPSHFRDPENRWFGLSVRARTIVYNTNKIKKHQLKSYEDLSDPKWKNRLLLRTSRKVYNQSLVAMLMVDNGEKRTEEIVRGWVSNLATKPFSNDTKVMKAIAAGQGDVGIVNTYYFGRLLKKNKNLPLALFWPDQDSKGVHVNISGAGITTHAKNRSGALAFLEWLSSKQAQNLFADVNLEYPVNKSVAPHPIVSSWGSFKQNSNNLSNAGKLQAASIRLMDRSGYR